MANIPFSCLLPQQGVRFVQWRYLVDVIGLTRGYHVSRNNRLAIKDPAIPEAAGYWARYLREWPRASICGPLPRSSGRVC